MDLVSPTKDVEGLNSTNLGYLIKFKRFLDEARGIKCVVPATAKAVVKILQAYPEIPIEGAFAVVVNNSMRVGKPLGLMLENLGATVVKCYDKTPRAYWRSRCAAPTCSSPPCPIRRSISTRRGSSRALPSWTSPTRAMSTRRRSRASRPF